MNDKTNEIILQAHARSFQRAFETAVRTGTSLIFAEGDQIVKFKPPYRYEMVPVKSPTKKSAKKSKK